MGDRSMSVHIENMNIRRIMEVAVAENAIIIDVRPREAFRAGHIPMAVNIPVEELLHGRDSFPYGRTLIFYCESGTNSMLAARHMAQRGYRVINAVGGIRMYHKELTKSRQ